MKVDKSKTRIINDTHSFEVGISSWNDEEKSIRCRYNAPDSGRFSPHGSSELPLSDLQPLIEVAAENDLLNIPECAAIIEALSKSIANQSVK
ncbi:hypothetical protein [Moritella dasanensis]|uniref:hypothetical protein n=1 Tax=Moritella dasanensis TaxID=428031 RepID=UPI000308BFF1|nr:hypothetical protein [Moritella dasanensis]